MMRPRRPPSAVYRVCGEEEYLAGADLFADWAVPAADERKHGRRLQRIAGAAALTGAVGTVGGVVGLAGLRAHAAAHRELAQRVVPSARAGVSRGHASTSGQVARRGILHPAPRPRRIHMHGGGGTPVRVSRVPGSEAETAKRAIVVSTARDVPERVASAEQDTATEAASAAGEVPSTTEARPQAQSEFGFER